MFWLIFFFVFLGSILPSIIKWVTFLLKSNIFFLLIIITLQILILAFKTTREEMDLRDEFRQLKKDLASISAVDEFAKFARLQRKINSVEEKILALGQGRADGRESLRWKWTKAIQIVNVYQLFSSSISV